MKIENEQETVPGMSDTPASVLPPVPDPMTIWNAELRQLCALAHLPPHTLKIRAEAGESQLLNASTGGKKTIEIDSGLLGCSQDVMRYILAHELGHILRRHLTIYYAVLAVTVAPIFIFFRIPLPLWTVVWAMVVFLTYVYLRHGTELFEFDADAAALALLNKAYPTQGRQIMEAGLDELLQARSAQASAQQVQDWTKRTELKKSKLT